jgi:hypothetical protein
MKTRNAHPDDFDRLRRFSTAFNRAGSSTFDDDFFTWQYEDAAQLAGTDDNGVLIAVEADEILGMAAGGKVRIYAEGNTVTGVWQQEWYADTSRFGVGLFLMMEQMRRNEFVGAAGQNYQAASVNSRIRPMVWFDLQRLFFPIDADATFDLLLAKSDHSRQFLSAQRAAKPASGSDVRAVARFDGAYDHAWRRFREDVLICADRSSAYMNWRYVDHPRFSYDCVTVSTPHGDVYFVWRDEPVRERGASVARICEVIGSGSAIVDGFADFLQVLEGRGVAFADFFCSHAPTIAALTEAGMRSVITTSDFDLPRLFQPLANDARKRINFYYTFADAVRPRDIHAFHRTYITKGDSNQDRPNP